MNTNAQETRVPGAYGTVEQQANPAKPAKYRTSSKPSLRPTGTAITAQGAAPSAAKRARIAQIEREQAAKAEAKRRVKASPRWAEYMGYLPSQDKYGVKVKLRGMKAETYWLPYSEAARVWLEITGEDFQTVIGTD